MKKTYPPAWQEVRMSWGSDTYLTGKKVVYVGEDVRICWERNTTSWETSTYLSGKKYVCDLDNLKTAHSVYDLKYHILWITKYRKPILRGEIGKRIRERIRQTCASLDVYIVKGHVSKDHT